MKEIASKLKLNLTCSFCSKILKNPIELRCDDLICQQHLNEKNFVEQDKIKCLNCEAEYQVKGQDFKLNKSIQKQIENKIYLNDEEITLMVKNRRVNKLFQAKNGLDLNCHNHFQEIRFQLNQHREKLKQKIDDICMEMIKKTKEVEASYLKSLIENVEDSIEKNEVKSIEDDLKDLEETFRNPNLLIESIQTILIKQQEVEKSIRLKFNEIFKINKNLNVSNIFKQNKPFNHDLFGQLNWGQYSSFDPFQSKLLTKQQSLELLKVCEFNSRDKFKLLYRASEHGFESNDFHSKCDGNSKTMSLF